MAENNENIEDTPTSEDLIFDSNEIYIPQEWSDSLDSFTPVSPSRLNHIEQGLYGTSKSLNGLRNTISQYIDIPCTQGILNSNIRLYPDLNMFVLCLFCQANRGNMSTIFKLIPSLNKKGIVIADLSEYLSEYNTYDKVVGYVYQYERLNSAEIALSVFPLKISAEKYLYYKADLNPTDDPGLWVQSKGYLYFTALNSLCFLA